ncbi:alpha-1-macroglobulin-like [Diadema antillarum]|uniref:alpha-1-macroglobulin-like n=1 Tax=Diadema antillarum TaxID=105358 RepID=UPI003A8B7F6E
MIDKLAFAVLALASMCAVYSALVDAQEASGESGVIVMYPKKLRVNKVGTGCFTMKNLVAPVSMELNITYLTVPCPTVIVQKSLDDVDTCLDVDLGCEATESERIGPHAGPILVNFHHVFTGERSTGRPFRQVFEKEMLLGYEVTHTFVQTDKPLYKPGQKVMFRVLTIDYPDMIPVPDHAHTVYIESPRGTRMKQWKNLLSPDGLLDLQFTLSDEPEMGAWRIRVIHDGHMPDSVQTFDVEEYVLPKFEVKVTPKTGYIFAPEPSPLLFTVCAMYTYGQPVRGSFEAEIWLRGDWFPTWTPERVSVEFVEGREVRPGQPASVRVSAQPSSLCAFGVVDKSVHIMAGDNQLTKDKVFTPVNSFNNVPFRRSVSCPRTEEIALPPNSNARTSWYSKHVDSSASFGMAGVDVMSDFELETRPCWVTITRYIPCQFPDPCWLYPSLMNPGFHHGLPDPGANVRFVLDSEPVPITHIPDRVELEPADEATPMAELRNYFPETWLWKLSRMGASGQQVTREEIPHTITDWVASAFCLSPTHGVGVADSTSIRAFQPFFLSYTLPYSVLRGERVPVKVSVFNYLSGCLTVELSMTESTSFSIETEPESPIIEVCGSISRTVEYELIFSELGDIPIRVDAVANRVADGNGEIGPGNYTFPAADALEDTILVEPEGAEREETFSEMICPNDEGDELYSNLVTLALPEVVVPGSARGRIQVIGDVIGPVMSNLGKLLRMPFGCGEQNMITMAPSIFVMHYLTETNQLTNEISSKALEYMESGYQRQLTYQLPDGSYSAFGVRDRVGSTWLSAFVLKCFSLAKEFMKVDETNLERTRNWLVLHSRNSQGCIINQGRVIHKNMQGSVSGPVTMTAFLTVAMLESGASPDVSYVMTGLYCMEHWLNTTAPSDMNTYTLAMVSYAFGLGNYFASQSRALSHLNDRAQEENGLRFWNSGDVVEREESLCIHHCHADSSSVETTAYVLLAQLHQNWPVDGIDDVLPIVRWLNSQRNTLGGFSSTQDTVLGLQAVAQFAERMHDRNSALDLQIGLQAFKSGSRDLTDEFFFDIDNNNHLLLQREDLREVPADIWVSSRGSGCALFQAELLYNVPVVPPQRPLFNIKVAIAEWNGRSPSDPATCGDRTVLVCVRYAGNERWTGMAVMEIKMVSGFIPHEDSLETFRREDGDIIGLKRIDKYVNGKPLALYFYSFDSPYRCVPIKVKQDMIVKNAKSSVIKVYDYYKPDVVSFENYHPCELANEE